MNIVKLQEEHIPALQKHFYQNADKEYIIPFIEDETILSYVVTLEGEVIGFIYGYLLKRINSLPMLYIHSVDVVKEYRGQGVGTIMMNEMLTLKAENKVSKVFLITNKSNKNAVALYEKVGGIAKYEDDIVYEYK